ncbi:lysophospholipid acyltransferase family protein [Deferribacter thermophilus]|uniref:lysophospholipid acyltransferase family protein n=1 Tax=Deferribacter thermophilus TaxID=53573 RepID=UPI003C2268B4
MNRIVLEIGHRILKLYYKTLRYELVNRDVVDKLRGKKEQIVFAIFHGQLLPFVYLHKGEQIVTIVSESKDGEIADFFLKKFGFQTVRGSSSRGGVKAVIGAKRLMGDIYNAAITVDGPKGPIYEVKPGVIYLAKKKNKPIIPAVAICNKYKQFNSWDKFILPFPFSKIKIIYGEPIYFSKHLDDDLLEKDRLFLQSRMLELLHANSN